MEEKKEANRLSSAAAMAKTPLIYIPPQEPNERDQKQGMAWKIFLL